MQIGHRVHTGYPRGCGVPKNAAWRASSAPAKNPLMAQRTAEMEKQPKKPPHKIRIDNNINDQAKKQTHSARFPSESLFLF